MKLQELRPAEGSTQSVKRVGRGTGSGLGKTSGKGHKGQNHVPKNYLLYPDEQF